MKILFNRNNSIGILCLLILLAVGAVSCIKDEYAENKEKATVQVTFMTRAISGNPNTTAGTLEEYEHMRTLRVIVARSSDNEILYNVKYDIAKNETSKTITFSELTVNKGGENFDFYAIANEDGVGYTEKSWDNVGIDDLKKMTLQNGFLTNVNDASTNTVIPQTAYKLINVAPQSDGGIQHKDMKLNFTVAKVRLTINNTSTVKQTVSNIKLSGVNTTSTKLFGVTPVTSTDTGEALSLGTMTDIPAETNGTPGKSTVYAYFYENTGKVYTLTATWDGHGQELDINNAVTPNIKEIPRGKMLDINVNLSLNTESTVNVQVVSWTEKEMDVPAFQ